MDSLAFVALLKFDQGVRTKRLLGKEQPKHLIMDTSVLGKKDPETK